MALPHGFALEFDALYKRLNYNFSRNESIPIVGIGTTGMQIIQQAHLIQNEHNIVSWWDLQLLLKYRLRSAANLKPYFNAGLNTNYIVNTTQIGVAAYTLGAASVLATTKNEDAPAELRYRSAEGIVIAGGFEFPFHAICIAPELRYTRWAHENFHEPGDSLAKLRSNLNQAEILFALRWAGK